MAKLKTKKFPKGLESTERDNVVKVFRAGKVWVLVCTELIGRDIDFQGVNVVVDYDFPQPAISYIQLEGLVALAATTR